MTLAEYLSQSNLTYAQFGGMIGADKSQVSRLVNGRRKPSLVMACNIERVTDGAVRGVDFIERHEAA